MAEATIRDVARRAAVSVASVSRALNAPSAVREELRERVLKAVAELGYSPHAGARSLSLRANQAIGVVLPDLHGEFFSELIRGMDREASAHGFQLLLSTMHTDVERASSALRAMRGRVDGLIAMAPQLDSAQIAAIVPRSLPAVLINSADGAGRHLLRIDNRHGAEEVVRHFVERGRRHFVHIAGPAGNLDAIERAEAFTATCRRLIGAEPIVLAGDFSEEAGRSAVEQLLRGGQHFDGLFAANDMMALGAIGALRAGGIGVPDMVAVAGFDDIPLARFLNLTTVRVRMDELGARAVAQLVAELRGSDPVRGIELVESLLVVRGSSGPPA
jgi:LacI family transcriptional regulator